MILIKSYPRYLSITYNIYIKSAKLLRKVLDNSHRQFFLQKIYFMRINTLQKINKMINNKPTSYKVLHYLMRKLCQY